MSELLDRFRLKYIDRQMILSYAKAYLVCLTSLLTLYVVVDLFMNLDDFAQNGRQLGQIAEKIVTYYGYRSVQIFDRLCEAIILLAAMFTVAWMQRNNEQVPLLSAGMSTQRIVLPVLLCAIAVMSLTTLNQELLIPRIADKLTLDKDDPSGEKELQVRGGYDPRTNIHLSGNRANSKQRMIKQFECTIPESLAGSLVHLTAAQAYYVPTGPRHGYWELTSTEPAHVLSFDAKVLEEVDTGRYRLYTSDLDFDALTRDPKWYILASTSELYHELQRTESSRLAAMAVLFHTRLTRPILGVLLVFMGLSVILRDQNRNVFISSGMCLALCGLFFFTCYCCKMLGDSDLISPAFAAWLPVLFFGPFAPALYDAMHT